MNKETQQALFNYFRENFGWSLLESEMQEIENIMGYRDDFSERDFNNGYRLGYRDCSNDIQPIHK